MTIQVGDEVTLAGGLVARVIDRRTDWLPGRVEELCIELASGGGAWYPSAELVDEIRLCFDDLGLCAGRVVMLK